MNLHFLYPTPVGIFHNENVEALSEHEELINLPYSMSNNFNRSDDTYVLDHHAPNLRSWICDQIQIYAKDAMAITDTFKITQSWCIKHQNEEQKIFSHIHPNSIISGAYYIDADDASEGITFYRQTFSNHTSIQWDSDPELMKNQSWNWAWYKIPVATGRLVLFPSHMKHGVDGKHNSNTRCVLSFNTWFSGTFGNKENLFELAI
jgi:uncharacterized protein (TIGR02466 family)